MRKGLWFLIICWSVIVSANLTSFIHNNKTFRQIIKLAPRRLSFVHISYVINIKDHVDVHEQCIRYKPGYKALRVLINDRTKYYFIYQGDDVLNAELCGVANYYLQDDNYLNQFILHDPMFSGFLTSENNFTGLLIETLSKNKINDLGSHAKQVVKVQTGFSAPHSFHFKTIYFELNDGVAVNKIHP